MSQIIRLKKELESMQKEYIPNISVNSKNNNLYEYEATIIGPTDTPYEGGIFECELFLPPQYPMEPPKVLFRTKIYHPNIDKLGRICLDILKNNWSPAL